MRIEDLIQTPESRQLKRRSAYNRAQFFCLGVSVASLVGSVDPWWKSLHVAALFFILFAIIGTVKVSSCRKPRRTYIARPLPLPGA